MQFLSSQLVYFRIQRYLKKKRKKKFLDDDPLVSQLKKDWIDALLHKLKNIIITYT